MLKRKIPTVLSGCKGTVFSCNNQENLKKYGKFGILQRGNQPFAPDIKKAALSVQPFCSLGWLLGIFIY
jgi:hypothetical protein